MPSRRKHHRKDAYDGNELVPIRVDLLRATLDDRGWGASALAEAVGSIQQTIWELLKEGQPRRRCRRELALRIANALEISFERLTRGPAVAPWTPLVPDGYEFRYSMRTELAASRLLTKCLAATKRDLGIIGPDPRPGTRSYFACTSLIGLVAELLQVNRWHHWLLEWDQDAIAQRGYTEPASDPWEGKARKRDPQPDEAPLPPGMVPVELVGESKPKDDPAHEEAILSLARALEHVLTPWFEGKAKLNYEGLQRLTYLPQPYPAQDQVDSFSPFAALPQPTESHKKTRTTSSTRRKK